MNAPRDLVAWCNHARSHVSRLLATGLILGLSSVSASAFQTWSVDQWTPPYNFGNAPTSSSYTALAKASKKWKLCVIFPHLKDPYWVATNYGVVEHAKKLGVAVDIYTSGGYPNLERQIEQVRACAGADYDAIVLGTVSYDKMTPTVVEAAKSLPVFATVNQILPDGISGMTAVDWIDMGRAAGRYFRDNHPAGSDKVSVAWIPGPEGHGWVRFTDQGFRELLAGSSAEIVTVKYGDTGKDIQQQLVQDALDEFPDVDYIAGNAVAIEAAMSVVRQRGLKDKIKLVADYFTPAMYRGLRRGLVASAPTDSAALQGTLSIDQAVRFLEGQVIADHVGPEIFGVDRSNIRDFPIHESLAPIDFTPVFNVQ